MKDTSFWLGIGGLAVAALTLILNFCIEVYRAKKQLELKKYEVEFLERRKAFVEFFESMRDTAVLVMNPKWAGEDLEKLAAVMGKQASAVYGLLPFLPLEDHEWAKRRINEIESHFHATWHGSDTERKEKALAYSKLIETVRKELFTKLFE